LASSVVLAGIGLVYYISDYRTAFVHPHRFDNHVDMLLGNRPGFGWRDFVVPFQEFAPGEYRPRFLTYFLMLVDLRLRMAAYEFFVPAPGASISWVFEMTVTPYLLYRLVGNLTGVRMASVSTVALYLSSIGFLSGVSMYFTPGKPLANTTLAAILFWMSEIERRRPGALFLESQLRERWYVLLVAFVGLFLDEMPIAIFMLVPVCFPSLFAKQGLSKALIARNVGFFLLPALAFLAFVLIVVPLLTQFFYGYRFDYLSSLLGIGKGAAGAKSFYEGPYGRFGVSNLFHNFSSLFGLSLTPEWIAPLTRHPSAGGVISGQATTVAKVAIFAIVAVALARLARGPQAANLRRYALACMVFVVFISLVSGRHVPFITGYYYGSAWAVPFSVFAGLSVGMAYKIGARACMIAAAAVLMIVTTQLQNYASINRAYRDVHNEGMVRHAYKEKLRLAAQGGTTRSELNAIWSAWKRGELATYLSANSVTPGAVFLIVELQWLERARKLRAS